MFSSTIVRQAARALVVCTALLVVAGSGWSATGKFYADDPIEREPETQDASGAKEREIDLLFDLTTNLFGEPGDQARHVRAGNINTIDEVPDSSWFTNRIVARVVSPDEAARGLLSGSGPASGTWTIIAPKRSGDAPGFTVRDAAGETWFVSFDAHGYPEAATSAIIVANRIFWTLGYWQVENYLTRVRPENLVLGESAVVRPRAGLRRKMQRTDLYAILRRANRSADGTYRAVAARAIPGRILGGFLYHGTRSDDPNDLVRHEHRRELRALKVFGAWTNLVDMKAGNTLDTLITENGRGTIRHYLQDVGSTFGTGANGPHEFDEGWEHLFERDPTVKRLRTLGFYVRPWQTVDYRNDPAIGRFEGDVFDPLGWKPRVPTAAFRHADPDDTFWAARRVMAFSDDLIRAVVATGQYSNPASAQLLSDVLIKRRDAIGRTYLTMVNPVVDGALDERGRLTFRNAAVDAGVAKPPAGYRAVWSTFDNASGTSQGIGESSGVSPSLQAPAGVSTGSSAFVKVELTATGAPHPSWTTPVQLYFRRQSGGWQLVGLERANQAGEGNDR